MRLKDMRVALVIALLVMGACARVSPETPPASSPAEHLYEADLTVLEDETHGPHLCVYGVMESFPPQCDGLPLMNWDWSLVEGEEAAQGARWGQFHVVGSYDGDRFAVVRATEYQPWAAGPSAEFSVPCPEPTGGWIAHEPALATEEGRLAATRYANDQAEHSGTWVQTVDGEPAAVINEDTILTVTFTGDLERHEQRLSELWGGPLCLARHALSLRQLSTIQRELADEQPFGLQMTWSSLDVWRNRVELGVIVTDEKAEQRLAERYGEGVVKLYPVLRPVS